MVFSIFSLIQLKYLYEKSVDATDMTHPKLRVILILSELVGVIKKMKET